MQRVYKEGEFLVMELKVPLKTKRSNPYDEAFSSEMNNIVGVIAGNEIGFSYWIDMDYKGKGDDVSVPFYLYHGGEGEFRELCKSLMIDLVEYPVCDKCYKPIYGSHTIGDTKKDGSLELICYDCQNKKGSIV